MIAWLLSFAGPSSHRRDPESAYQAAHSRFVYDTVDINGVAYVRKTDPVLGIQVAVDAPNHIHLHGMFRSKWMARCE